MRLIALLLASALIEFTYSAYVHAPIHTLPAAKARALPIRAVATNPIYDVEPEQLEEERRAKQAKEREQQLMSEGKARKTEADAAFKSLKGFIQRFGDFCCKPTDVGCVLTSAEREY